jgi:ribonuclease D
MPVFDTQVAAMVLGFGDSVSYDALCRKVVGQPIDKSSRFTDWARRPLSEKQLTYALADVTHLRDIYAVLSADLAAAGRQGWVAEELAVLTSPETYIQRPEDSWERVKPKPKSRRALAVLIEVAAWREREAQAADVPRNRILKDEALADIAVNEPRGEADLGMLRSVPNGFERSRAAAGILAAVEAGRRRDLVTLPALPQREPLPQRLEPIVELLKVVLRLQSRRQRVAQRLIATTDDLERIALDDEADVPALKGWRREAFGAVALDVKHGRRAILVRGGKVRLIRPDAAVAEPAAVG